ncbi:MAG: PqqD family protein [Ramlibacter sp.]|nr:PqqD family protein [Ramlibacter sp.]
MTLMNKVRIPSQVMARQVGDEMVILDLASGNYFGLGPVGARAWQLISEGRTFADACEVLVDEYDVTRDVLEGDLLRLKEQLISRGLIVES